MIAIIDYNAGNLTSVEAALKKLNKSAIITSDPAEIAKAERVIFPGVGAAGSAMQHLKDMGLIEALQNFVASGKPFLGICLGYQILFEHSDEDNTPCLGFIDGKVVRFSEKLELKIPHMGWNEVTFHGKHPIWNGIPTGSEFYYVHSFYPKPADSAIAATTSYGAEFACGSIINNLVGFQFHPEKSGRPGLKLLENFCNWEPKSC